jgi:acyl carrier protein
MAQFLERIAEVLEVPSVTPDFAFRSAPGWSSLMGFALIILLDQQYHVTLTVEEFMKLVTVADLARAAGVDA